VGFGRCVLYSHEQRRQYFLPPANFVLADFGKNFRRVVSSITVTSQCTTMVVWNDETQLHIFVKNRKSDTSDSGDPGSLAQHIQNYADAENNWFAKNPYLGCALCANVGAGWKGDAKRVNISLRSKPILLKSLLSE